MIYRVVCDWYGSSEAVAGFLLLDLPGEGVALRACIDASRAGTGVFTIAGVAFGYQQALKANDEWERLMKGRTFHMTDLNARRGDFNGIDDDEKKRIIVGVVSILKKRASFMVAVSCDDANISEQFPVRSSGDRTSEEIRNAFRSPYGVMCHLCMTGLAGVLEEKRSKPGNAIAYVLEAGDDGQKGLTRFIDYTASLPGHKRFIEMYAMSSYSVANKEGMLGIFHAADFVAWEWSRHVGRHRCGEVMRRSLAELTGQISATPDYFGMTIGRKGRHLFRHYDDRHLDRFVRFLRETAEAPTSEQSDAALDQWAKTRFEEASQLRPA